MNKGSGMCFYLHMQTYPTSSEVWTWNLRWRPSVKNVFVIVPGKEIAQAVTLQKLWFMIFEVSVEMQHSLLLGEKA